MIKIPDRYRDLLDRPIVVSLATLMSDGPPQVQPVWGSFDGTHILVYNDVRPGLLVDVIRGDPERLWRQGLLGLGGLGMAIDFGYGFGRVEGIDLNDATTGTALRDDLDQVSVGFNFRPVERNVFKVSYTFVDTKQVGVGSGADTFTLSWATFF